MQKPNPLENSSLLSARRDRMPPMGTFSAMTKVSKSHANPANKQKGFRQQAYAEAAPEGNNKENWAPVITTPDLSGINYQYLPTRATVQVSRGTVAGKNAEEQRGEKQIFESPITTRRVRQVDIAVAKVDEKREKCRGEVSKSKDHSKGNKSRILAEMGFTRERIGSSGGAGEKGQGRQYPLPEALDYNPTRSDNSTRPTIDATRPPIKTENLLSICPTPLIQPLESSSRRTPSPVVSLAAQAVEDFRSCNHCDDSPFFAFSEESGTFMISSSILSAEGETTTFPSSPPLTPLVETTWFGSKVPITAPPPLSTIPEESDSEHVVYRIINSTPISVIAIDSDATISDFSTTNTAIPPEKHEDDNFLPQIAASTTSILHTDATNDSLLDPPPLQKCIQPIHKGPPPILTFPPPYLPSPKLHTLTHYQPYEPQQPPTSIYQLPTPRATYTSISHCIDSISAFNASESSNPSPLTTTPLNPLTHPYITSHSSLIRHRRGVVINAKRDEGVFWSTDWRARQKRFCVDVGLPVMGRGRRRGRRSKGVGAEDDEEEVGRDIAVGGGGGASGSGGTGGTRGVGVDVPTLGEGVERESADDELSTDGDEGTLTPNSSSPRHLAARGAGYRSGGIPLNLWINYTMARTREEADFCRKDFRRRAVWVGRWLERVRVLHRRKMRGLKRF